MKIYMVSLAFVPARIAIESMKQIYATIGDIKFEHHILQQHYPIAKDLNDRLLYTLFDHYDCNVHDLGKNIGLSGGYNYLINRLNLKDDDLVIGTDLDVYPVTQGWGEALKRVAEADTNVGWISLQNQHSARELQERGYTPHNIGGVLCHEGHQACVQSIIGWTGRSLLGMGKLEENNQWYGGMESRSFPRLKALGLKWVYLPQYEEKFSPLVECDAPYRHYKWNLAHLKTTTLDFESWINEDKERLKLT
jgi:hypothetical protein